MTFTPEDRQELIGIVGEAMTQVVMPLIVEINERLDHIEGRLDGIDGRLNSIEETLKEHGERLDSIELKVDATIASTDRLDVRLTRVEQHAGLAPVAR